MSENWTPITSLRPTQLTLGLREVERRAIKIAAMSADKRRGYIKERTVPCVLGPQAKAYIIDRHHMCRALLQAGEKQVVTEQLHDASNLSADEFWTYMDLQNLVHPFDAAGKRCPIATLGDNVNDLVDDPYRGLAGFLRREHGYTKSNMPFEEFTWADFLRRRIPATLLAKDYDKAREKAYELAQSKEARHLPGWGNSR